MQSNSREHLVSSLQNLDQLTSADIEALQYAPKATVLIVMHATSTEHVVVHFALPYSAQSSEAYDPAVHFDPERQTVIGKCQIAELPDPMMPSQTKRYVLRAEIDKDLATHWPDAGDWQTILFGLLRMYNLTLHPTLYALTTKLLGDITPFDFETPLVTVV